MEDRIPQQAKELNHKRARRRTWHKVLGQRHVWWCSVPPTR